MIRPTKKEIKRATCSHLADILQDLSDLIRSLWVNYVKSPEFDKALELLQTIESKKGRIPRLLFQLSTLEECLFKETFKIYQKVNEDVIEAWKILSTAASTREGILEDVEHAKILYAASNMWIFTSWLAGLLRLYARQLEEYPLENTLKRDDICRYLEVAIKRDKSQEYIPLKLPIGESSSIIVYLLAKVLEGSSLQADEILKNPPYKGLESLLCIQEKTKIVNEYSNVFKSGFAERYLCPASLLLSRVSKKVLENVFQGICNSCQQCEEESYSQKGEKIPPYIQ
jgi:hypothetical protein